MDPETDEFKARREAARMKIYGDLKNMLNNLKKKTEVLGKSMSTSNTKKSKKGSKLGDEKVEETKVVRSTKRDKPNDDCNISSDDTDETLAEIYKKAGKRRKSELLTDTRVLLIENSGNAVKDLNTSGSRRVLRSNTKDGGREGEQADTTDGVKHRKKRKLCKVDKNLEKKSQARCTKKVKLSKGHKKKKVFSKRRFSMKGTEEEPEVTEGRTKWLPIYSRTSPSQFYSCIGKLSNHMRGVIRRIGFGKLLTMKLDSIPVKLGHFVVDNLDTERMVIVTEKGEIKVDVDSVSSLLGLPEGGIELGTLNKQKKNDNFKVWKNRFPGTRFFPSAVVALIEENKYEVERFFVLDFLLVFITTMVECWNNGMCRTSILSRLDEGRNVKEYDWCTYIVETIRNCKVGWVRDDKKSPFTGPITILTLLYVESTECEGFKHEMNGGKLEFWTSDRLKEREELELKNGGFGKGKLRNMLVDLTNHEDHKIDVKQLKDKQAKIEEDLLEYFDENDLNGQLSLIESVVSFIRKDKSHLEKLLRNAVINFPGNKEVKSFVSEYEEIFRVCVNFDVEDEDTSSNDSDDDGDDDQDNGEGDGDNENGDDNDFNLNDDDGGLDEYQEGNDTDEVPEVDQNDNNSIGEGEEDIEIREKGMSEMEINKLVTDLVSDLEGSSKVTGSIGELSLITPDIPCLVKEAVSKMLEDDGYEVDELKTPNVKTPVILDGSVGQTFTRNPLETSYECVTPGTLTQSEILVAEGVEMEHSSVKSVVYKEVRSAISKLRLEAKLRELEGPTFSLGLTQYDVTPVKSESGKTTQGRKKMVCRSKKKRTVKSAGVLCSPYIQRVVDINKCVTIGEKKVWDYIFTGAVDNVEIAKLVAADPNYNPLEELPPRTFESFIFGNKHCGGITLGCFRTLATNEWVMNEVVDAFTFVVNYEEGKRSPSSPVRLVFSTLFSDWIVGNKNGSSENMNQMLVDYLDKATLGDNGLRTLKDVDIVMFPVLENHHYYLLCFELKNLCIVVIDNMEKSRVSLLDDVVYAKKSIVCKLKHVFVNYLRKVGHPKWKDVQNLVPEKLKISWTTTDNFNDCGVFLMRHIEMYYGCKDRKFQCGFPRGREEKKKKVNALRRKYACKILTCEANEYKKMVVDESADLYLMKN